MSEKLRSIVVDDEINCRENLNIFLRDFCPEVSVIGMAGSAEEARQLIVKEQPDVVFLDIAMPVEDGFSLLKSFPDREFDVVFTTAHNEYAVQAFKENAIDYIEKPISIEDLQKAVHKVLNYRETGSHNHEASIQKVLRDSVSFSDKISIPTKGGFIIAQNKEVIHFEASDNYTTIHLTENRKYVSTKNIKIFEEHLNPDVFIRVHKSHIINIKYHVKQFSRNEGGYVTLSNGKHVPVSRRKLQEFLDRIHPF
jgi:two-component system LytT family response regulator